MRRERLQILHLRRLSHFGFRSRNEPHRSFDPIYRVLSKFSVFNFVFPYPQDAPTDTLQVFVVRRVPFHVPSEFGEPVVVVPCWHRGMFGTTMPKASIDENRDALCREHHVHFHAAPFKFDVPIFPKPETHAMHHAPKRDLRFGVRSPVRHHRSSRGLVGGGRCGGDDSRHRHDMESNGGRPYERRSRNEIETFKNSRFVSASDIHLGNKGMRRIDRIQHMDVSKGIVTEPVKFLL